VITGAPIHGLETLKILLKNRWSASLHIVIQSHNSDLDHRTQREYYVRWSTQSFGHNISMWQRHRQPRRHSKCRANSLAIWQWRVKTKGIKLCPREAQTCALPLFCDRDLEINLVTLKLQGDLNILQIYLQAANLGHSKHRAWVNKIRKYVSR